MSIPTSHNSSQAPLLFTAKRGHERVLKMLLEREEVNSDKPDNLGRTPLWDAAWYGHEGVVEILLGREEVDPDKPDNCGGRPLSCAAENGHEGVVKKTYLSGTMSTPTSQTIAAEHRSFL